ncbi:MAG TPA: magnesium-translocating P-type ATPase, partial [Solirubrobacteraceae bacterium]|nr:magnesium-translocating P-type ATPase [Solirubrobacteraceae bacterium]
MTPIAENRTPSRRTDWSSMTLASAASRPAGEVLAALRSTPDGLCGADAARRLTAVGPNALRSHGARPLAVLVRQLRNPLLVLLVAAAVTSIAVGERTSALIILLIIAMSVGLGFFNEYRSELAVESLHSQLRHTALVMRDGTPSSIDVTKLVPGDIVRLAVGDVVPADLRLLAAEGLECDEAVLTGESLPAEKHVEPVTATESALDLASCAFMGTVVREGTGLGVAVQTGGGTEFGAIAMSLGERQPQTSFQLGLRAFSLLLVRVTVALAGSILLINVALGRSLLGSVLFALAIAVGLTPQLLPAIVTISLATGAKRLAARKVVVKRLVSIEDLGNVAVLFTDKTGTLTEGQITFAVALDARGRPSDEVLRAGLLCNEATVTAGQVIGGNQLDRALWQAPAARRAGAEGAHRIAALPFDYQRRLASVLIEQDGRRELIVKGAPESVLARCREVEPQAQAVLDRQFAAGSRIIAVARRPAPGQSTLRADDEHNLQLTGFLAFVDRPKSDAGEALERLRRLDVRVKIITGDNDRVAQKVCRDIGLAVDGTLTGSELDRLDDAQLAAALPTTTIFARVSPEQKSRLIKAQRALGSTVGFLGDGVNDAVALHDADVGISVQTATDVAKDAADIVLLDKDLDILATGIVEGRRIFANTIKYVLMGTSSNFGNMFSAAGASLFLSFLPMLPTQILLNNLLYDASEMAIPTDNVDEEQLQRPAHWDTAFIRRFMVFFGPISSIFDFATFGIMLWIFHAHAPLFRSGWFVESLATQSLIIFAIRTRRVPFWASRASIPVTVATVACVTIGIVLPFSPLAHVLGFVVLPVGFLLALGLMIAIYLGLVEAGKVWFYRGLRPGPPLAWRRPAREHLIHHRATRWSIVGRPRMPRGVKVHHGRPLGGAGFRGPGA